MFMRFLAIDRGQEKEGGGTKVGVGCWVYGILVINMASVTP